MRHFALALVAGSIFAAAPPARGQGLGPGSDPGFVLDMPDTGAINSVVTICMEGPASTLGLFMASLGQGPFSSPYGPIELDFPLAFAMPFVFDIAGSSCFDVGIPCDPSVVEVTVYAQFITARPNGGLSNQDSITLTDGLCVGDLVTFNELEWGSDCDEGTEKDAGCILIEWFDRAFPEGLTVGDQSGEDDDFFAIHFTSAAAITGFLPANDGAPEILDSDTTDPTASNAGDIAGQLAGLRLNVVCDDIGAFDDIKARPDLKFGELIIVANVNPDLFGLTVRELLDICDLAISGALGEGDLDIDGDGDQDSTLKDLSDALRALNKEFEDGAVHRGSVGLP